MKFRRLLILFCIGCLLLSTAACGKKEDGEFTLSDEDIALLEKVKDDINVVSDENYVETINAFHTNSATLAGSLYQIEGLISYKDIDGEETAFLYRNHTEGAETSELGVALRYLPEKIKEGDWVKITGILTAVGHDDHQHTYLDVVTIETPKEHGSETIK